MRKSTLISAMLFAFSVLNVSAVLAKSDQADEKTAKTETVEIDWQSDYSEAMRAAEGAGKMLLIFFEDSEQDELCRRFEQETLTDEEVRNKLQDYVCAKLPMDAEIAVDGKQQKLLKHASFKEMLGRPGIAVVDCASEDAKLRRSVVSTFPINAELFYTPKKMKVILDLPRGTLTQRTLIYAVRIHPEAPASTNGMIDGYLLSEAKSHSQHQARIHLQGHHNWDSRFHRINAKLEPGLYACEVCAESWPGEHLVEAAIECVRCWRFSSGHWSSVRAYHRVYGYDMKCGSNGIWYATGIFGKG